MWEKKMWERKIRVESGAWRRDPDRNRGSLSRGGVDGVRAAEHPHALGDACQTHALRRGLSCLGVGQEAASVVAHADVDLPVLDPDLDVRLGRLRMLDDVVDALLDDPIKVDLIFLRKKSVERRNVREESDAGCAFGLL